MTHRLKSLYVSLFIAGSIAGAGVSMWKLALEGMSSPWLGTLVACSGPVLFFARVFLVSVARTSRNLPEVLGAGLLGSFVSIVLAGSVAAPPVLVAVLVGVVGVLLYVYWYSRFGAPASNALRVGATLPEFRLVENGRAVSSTTLVGRPALWIFYRGNWCPLCVAQIHELAAEYRELARRGVEVFLVSPQPESRTSSLAAKVDAPMRFLTDIGNAAAAALGILEKAGLPAGMQVLGYDSDVPRPTAFLTDAGGRVIHCDVSDNYRVRPEPSAFFEVLDRHAIRAS
jgi:peroxiredoxin